MNDPIMEDAPVVLDEMDEDAVGLDVSEDGTDNRRHSDASSTSSSAMTPSPMDPIFLMKAYTGFHNGKVGQDNASAFLGDESSVHHNHMFGMFKSGASSPRSMRRMR